MIMLCGRLCHRWARHGHRREPIGSGAYWGIGAGFWTYPYWTARRCRLGCVFSGADFRRFRIPHNLFACVTGSRSFSIISRHDAHDGACDALIAIGILYLGGVHPYRSPTVHPLKRIDSITTALNDNFATFAHGFLPLR